MAGFLDTLRTFFSPPPALPTEPYISNVELLGPASESRSMWEWNTGSDYGRGNTTAGEYVDADKAFRSIAVQAAIRLLVNDIGSLPVDAYRKTDTGREEIGRPSWIVAPSSGNPNLTWEDHVKQVVYGVLAAGESFTTVFPSVFDPRDLTVIEAQDVRKVYRDGGSVAYDVAGFKFPLTPANMIHVPWMLPPGELRGVNPIEAAREGLGIALAADKFVGSYFGNGAILSGVIEYPLGVDPTPEQVKQLRDDFTRRHVGSRKSHAVGALTGGATFKPFDYSNRDAQLLELRDQIVEEVARLFGIPPHMLGSQKPGAVGYASVEQRSIDYVTHAVLPIVRRIETAYSRLLYGGRTYIRFNLEGLQRGDSQGRAQFYAVMLQNKVMRRDEVRAKEDLPYDAEAVGYLQTPNNNYDEPADDPADEPTDDAAPDSSVTNNFYLPPNPQVRVEPTINVAPAAVTVPPQAAPVVNVMPSPTPVVNVTTDTTDMAEAVRELGASLASNGTEERRALHALASREQPAPVINVMPAPVKVTMPDRMAVDIVSEPKSTKRTRVVARNAQGQIVETVTEE